MKLKFDDDGHVVVEDGMPVYIHEDESEAPFDAAAASKKINNLTEEKDRHYGAFQDASKKLKAFDGIKDPKEALKAIETVKNLDAKKLVDAGEVDSLKRQLLENAETEKNQLIKNFNEESEKLNEQISAKDNSIFKLMITNEFAKSELFAGPKPKTVLTPDIAAEYFGKNFKIEEVNGELQAVGYLAGEKILSKTRHGELATFHEAIEVIVDKYPMKNRIMAAGNPGGGGSGNTGKNKDDSKNLTSTEKIAKGLKQQM